MNEWDRRELLRAGAGSTMVGAAVAAPAMARARPQRPPSNQPVLTIASRADLSTMTTPAVGDLVFLEEAGREGFFRCRTGPAPAVGDALQGIYIQSTASDLHFERVWDGLGGRPEWFGARTSDPDSDCADAIEACFALCPVTELSLAEYFVRRTIRLRQSGHMMRGIGRFANRPERGTRIILSARAAGAGTDDIMMVGGDQKPVSSEDELFGDCQFHDFTLVREAACRPHASGDIARYPAGLRASFLIRCIFSGIASLESSVGFYIGNVVYTKFDDCMTQRLKPGTTSAGDRWIGYYLNGRIGFGYAGGNASLYMSRCLVVDQHGTHVDPTGLLATGAFVDSFIDDFESARIATGMAFSVAGYRAFGQTVDLHIRNAVLDGCSRRGIDIDLDATSSAAIEIIDPYVAGSGSGGDRGITVRDGAGVVTIVGGQVLGDFRNGSLYFDRTRAIRVQGTKIIQASRPVVVGEASALILEPQINNFQMTSPNFAIECRHLERSIVRPIVIGAASPAFVGGVSLGAESNHCQVDGTAIDPGCLSAPDPRYKTWFAGADARDGESGRAFRAAGNVLSGVTD